MPIARAELEDLLQREFRPDGHVLSVYLNVDQSQAANLNRGFAAALKARLRSLEQQLDGEKLRREFAEDSQQVVQALATYQPRGRGLALFCDASDGFFWQRDLKVGVETEVRWDQRPYLRPLIEAMDEYERYAVVLVSREHARLFTIMLGEIEERREISSENKIKRIKSPGNESARSQINIQRKDEEHAQHHMKEVIEALEDLAARRPFDRLVLAGPHEVTREFQALLPKRLQTLVVSSVPLPMEATEREILAEMQRVEGDIERAAESAMVERIITQAAKGAQAVVGPGPVLEALRMGKIMRLLYAHGRTIAGRQCTNCGTLFAGGVAPCPYCGGNVREIPDVISTAAERVVHSGGFVENVRGPAAANLEAAGGIGAFLRF
ncbi:MAG: hypothetical protein ACM3S5_10135 [Rhodospirillales bacterium]